MLYSPTEAYQALRKDPWWSREIAAQEGYPTPGRVVVYIQGGTTHDTRLVLWRNRQAVRLAFCRHQHGGDGVEFDRVADHRPVTQRAPRAPGAVRQFRSHSTDRLHYYTSHSSR